MKKSHAKDKALLIDVIKCTGCEKCVKACKAQNNLPPEKPFARLSADGLSSRRYTTIVQLPEQHFARKMCLHCLEPSCVEACLVGAIVKTPEGPVIYDAGKCIGCRYCMLACPMDIPRYEWEKKLPYMRKCEMCFDLVGKGGAPACVEACPEQACVFGERDELLKLAKETIQGDAKYLPRIYGEKELGGTSVLYIADVPLEKLGWPEQLTDSSIHDITWRVINKTPLLGVGVASMLCGTMFIINRRMKAQEQAARKAESVDGHRDNDKNEDNK